MVEQPESGNSELSAEAQHLLDAAPHARHLLALADEEARRFGHAYVGQEHLLLALARDDESDTAEVLRAYGVEPAQLSRAVEYIVGRGQGSPDGPLATTPRLAKALELAVALAHRAGRTDLGAHDLLLALVSEREGIGGGVLASLGLTERKLLGRDPPTEPPRPRDAVLAGPKGNVLTCRIADADLAVIDAFVEAGIRASRSEAAAWLIHAGITANQPLVARVFAALGEIRRLRDELRGDD